MNKKIVFFDIDGTLNDEKNNIVPQSCIDALHKAHKNGHLLIVNTGRPISTIENMITSIGFDGYICGCGTYVQYQNEVIMHATLDEIIRKEVIRQIYKCHMQAVLEGEKGAFFSKGIINPFVLMFKKRYEEQGFVAQEFDEHDIIDFDKMAIWYDENSDIDTFKKYLKQYFEIIQRDSDFIEVVPLGYSKATGIQCLIDYLGMNIDDCICIGDSTNDLPMLTYTKESVAMGNANPILFDKVTYITTSAENDGIQNALKHFKLI